MDMGTHIKADGERQLAHLVQSHIRASVTQMTKKR